jgi:hypothetical protein
MRTTSRRSAAAAPTCWRTLRATATLLVAADEGMGNAAASRAAHVPDNAAVSPTPPPPELDEA